ncbi:hypothetical protein KIW84_020967 [Lathyrus oleraceus]|uniref:Glycine-rich protein n=1 Tax=Pisum sativum TaxID=3888 RepID=A0A9D4Y7V3_PEA|nr:hypothetical protein KIW84_020967 [Pisum sativum]
MKIKCFIFAFFLCALIFITVVAIEPSKDDEKQTREFEKSEIKFGINKVRRLREGGHGRKHRKRHINSVAQVWINGGENIGLGGQGKIGNEERRNEVSSIGEENKGVREEEENEGFGGP